MKKYQVVINYLLDYIEKNKIKAGYALPSVRVLVEDLAFNKSTIIRAYQELEKDHMVYSIPKSGYYLLESDKGEKNISDLYDLEKVQLDQALLPYNAFNHAINKAIEKYTSKLFNYHDVKGLESLRDLLEVHLKDNQVYCSKKNIIITSGSQQALHILMNIDYPNKRKKILVESPTYDLFIKSADLSNIDLVSIPLSDGVDLKGIEKIFRSGQIKAFYTMPRFHNPTGYAYTEKEKQGLVNLAYKYDVYIIEDDYLCDLDTKKSPTLHYYDTGGKVIYLKSFSKVFMPGMRCGVAVVPDSLMERFCDFKSVLDISTSLLSQGGLEIFIESGMYKKHIHKISKIYSRKMLFCKQILKSLDNKRLNFSIPDSGIFIYLESDLIDLDNVIECLKEEKILLKKCDGSFLESSHIKSSIRLSIAHMSDTQLEYVLVKLVETANRLRLI